MSENMKAEGSITLKSNIIKGNGKEKRMLELCKLFPFEM